MRQRGKIGNKQIAMGIVLCIVMAIEWILLVAGTKPHEMIVGAACILVSISFLYVVRLTNPLHVDFRFADVATGWRIPWYILTGTWQITVVLFKDLLGIQRAKSLYLVSGFKTGKTDPVLAGRRVLATAYTTTSPSSIVVGIDYEQSRMLFHALQPDDVSIMAKQLGAQPGTRARTQTGTHSGERS